MCLEPNSSPPNRRSVILYPSIRVSYLVFLIPLICMCVLIVLGLLGTSHGSPPFRNDGSALQILFSADLASTIHATPPTCLNVQVRA
jgi:hypothetical protein